MDFRNIAIIAHVDHGKTTLVDQLFKQSGVYSAHQEVEERAMDSGAIEKERGITILSKCTSVSWGQRRINIVDTPGHADFGGEVERILSMVDGVLLLVDASEGPMPQTKFVVSKALALGLQPIVIINKVDKPDARPREVVDEVFELFMTLDANEEQLDFLVIYASAKEGWAVDQLDDDKKNLSPIFEAIIAHVSPPVLDVKAPFSMIVTMLDAAPYLGRILTGRVQSGIARVNMPIKAIDLEGRVVESGKLTKLLSYQGLDRKPVDQVVAGDIVAIAGLKDAIVANTICDPMITEPIAAQPIDPPTLSMTFSVNSSPLSGQDGKSVTSSLIGERLQKEAERNVSIRIAPTAQDDAFEVSGRGELQLGILIENMRREGFELSVSKPQVLFKEQDGKKLEPIEEVVIDVDDEYAGTIIEAFGVRKGEMVDMRNSTGGKTRLSFLAPSRGLIGYHNQFMTETRGTGMMTRLFHSYQPFKGPIPKTRNGVLISLGQGKALAYALANLESRGILFIGPSETIYEGMIIGEHNRTNDLEVNALKGKQLTNMRAASKDDGIKLAPPRRFTLEEALTYIEDDELLEITPHHIRLRKRHLNPHERKRKSRK
ncbi:MAG: translational GTPase TypA [Bacteroidota bacterium]